MRITRSRLTSALVLLFGAIAAFLSPYVAPVEMPLVERAAIFVLLFGGAILLAYGVGRLVPRGGE